MQVQIARLRPIRARTTLAQYYHMHNLEGMKIPPDDERTRELLDRYVQAWDTALCWPSVATTRARK